MRGPEDFPRKESKDLRGKPFPEEGILINVYVRMHACVHAVCM